LKSGYDITYLFFIEKNMIKARRKAVCILLFSGLFALEFVMLFMKLSTHLPAIGFPGKENQHRAQNRPGQH
jgi:hypothetical protein